ncbi:flagellar basal body P-ring protein FlgI [Oceanidesulfovibrio marinus]|uniref:Flagellar P-ring protein n=1 Tax=Oceanidesulfovibrio marinus TaxID=370038 RepID=A0ABX6NJ21_9BACT|nr:flagellar basal body P-ring protein FlgI [Oceanidesulfovibrio marinus]QJT10612.1 flagellar basal body P-ring protein FlgI [Oceanidesulfovibrio marinus]
MAILSKNMTRGALALVLAALVCAGILGAPTNAHAVRLKDIATFGGVRNNQLVGYGLVVGLAGTGDSRKSEFTIQSLVNMLEVLGVAVDKRNLRPKNVAAVMVTAQMPVSSKPGTRLDTTVSSLGDAESLLGGVLLMTPLKGIDGKVYGLAQGALTVGGFSVQGDAASASKNISTVALIPNGATVERGVPFHYNDQQQLKVHMNEADFTTTMEVVEKINQSLGGEFARAEDISTIDLAIPPRYEGNLVPFMASLESLEVSPDSKAKVVVDEKTGTVVLGRNVRLSKAAVAHGNLQIVIQENANVSQPGAFSQGQTVVTPETNLGVDEQNRRLTMLEGATLQELVDGLNAIGATPRDLISILRTLKSAGALHAELEVI